MTIWGQISILQGGKYSRGLNEEAARVQHRLCSTRGSAVSPPDWGYKRGRQRERGESAGKIMIVWSCDSDGAGIKAITSRHK